MTAEEKELISVIIPVYNKEKYLRKCLESVLAQTYTDTEVILVDDASSDKSGNICDEYAGRDERISVIHLKENRGVSHARNVGIDRAEGEFICFVDADDCTDKDMLGRLYDSMKENQADVSICGVNYFGFGAYTDNKPEGKDVAILSGEEAVFCMVNRQLFDCGLWGKLFTRGKVMRCRFHEAVYCGEDILFLYHLFQYAQRISYLPDKLYDYIYRSDSVTRGGFHIRQYSEFLVYEYLCRRLGDKYPELLIPLEQRILAINLRLAVKAVESGEVRGWKLYAYLKRFQKNIRRYLNWKALACFEYKKVALETVLLSASTEIFWATLIIYKKMRRYTKPCE